MKKFSLLFIIVSLFFSPISFAEGLKIGVVDFRTIVAVSPQSRAIGEKLKQEFKPREEKIIETEKNLKEKAEKLQRNSAIMSEAEKSRLDREVTTAQRELQRLQYEFREDTSLRQREEMQKLVEVVQKEVEKIAKSDKYDLIMQNDTVPYFTDKINITEQVLKAMAGA